jgi:mannosyltransferase OCH1-like enzyme
MIPRIIHQTSRSKLLSFEERQLQKRFRDLLPDWNLNVWDEDDNERLICELFPSYHGAYKSIGKGVARADIVRTIYLYKYGGFYFDTDYKLLKPIGEDILKEVCVLPISRGSDVLSPEFRLGNCVLGSEPDFPFWRDFVVDIFESGRLENIGEHTIEKITGPEGLTRFYVNNRNRYPEVCLPPRNAFHPLITCRGLSWEKGHSSYGAHLCWGSWRTKGPLRKAKTLLVRKVTCF